ncbi:uncharacterized protein MONBRDRAFT_9731 [Monosiga brevicollis MX1]|uniref:PPM-type phosphatase domain-containing protein n=1 Tax=Monosiga brevicollis TaxID=81824 RepID=A9V422_MONBE|nr:uncharacterized protein MONBRDRAFT_9731 [Monosiga brevicollis MX1]EDQ87627.1 predicted protein [Monosiga brevicollis MX1]|eukprot:XP_001747547.1 hypothetical protein [Monosiga brevicollis MX1]
MFRRRSTKKGLRAAEAAAAANAASDNIDDNDTITQTSLSRKPTKKKGVMRRVFSFKRNTSASNFHAEAGESEDANDIFPEMVVGHATDLGFNHPDNEDRCNVILDLFTDAPQEEAKYVGTSDRRLAVFTVFDGHGGKTCSDVRCFRPSHI